MYEVGTGLELGEYGESEFGEIGEYGEFGESEFGETGQGEYGEFAEYGQGEYGEFAEYGQGEYGEFAEFAEFGEYGESEDEVLVGEILGSVGGEVTSPLSEAMEIQLASELLEISSEEELEQFLGKLFKGVSRGLGKFIKSPVGKALGGVLKSVAKKALPVVGGALGSMVAPGIGTALGSKLGSMASGLFEVELEGMPQEQAEFEVARRYVALSAAAARNAALAQPGPGTTPQAVARAAVAQAARTHAPGLNRAIMPSVRRSVGYQRPGAAVAARGIRRAAGRPGPRRPVAGARSRPGLGRGGWPGAFAPGGLSAGAGYPANGAGDGGFAPPTDQYGAAPGTGRWIRRGRRIILLGV